jgi:uncharacterized protein YndB with AHSA1/START domain
MADTFVGHASVTINAPRAKVWDALVNPDTIIAIHAGDECGFRVEGGKPDRLD